MSIYEQTHHIKVGPEDTIELQSSYLTETLIESDPYLTSRPQPHQLKLFRKSPTIQSFHTNSIIEFDCDLHANTVLPTPSCNAGSIVAVGKVVAPIWREWMGRRMLGGEAVVGMKRVRCTVPLLVRKIDYEFVVVEIAHTCLNPGMKHNDGSSDMVTFTNVCSSGKRHFIHYFRHEWDSLMVITDRQSLALLIKDYESNRYRPSAMTSRSRRECSWKPDSTFNVIQNRPYGEVTVDCGYCFNDTLIDNGGLEEGVGKGIIQSSLPSFSSLSEDEMTPKMSQKLNKCPKKDVKDVKTSPLVTATPLPNPLPTSPDTTDLDLTLPIGREECPKSAKKVTFLGHFPKLGHSEEPKLGHSPIDDQTKGTVRADKWSFYSSKTPTSPLHLPPLTPSPNPQMSQMSQTVSFGTPKSVEYTPSALHSAPSPTISVNKMVFSIVSSVFGPAEKDAILSKFVEDKGYQERFERDLERFSPLLRPHTPSQNVPKMSQNVQIGTNVGPKKSPMGGNGGVKNGRRLIDKLKAMSALSKDRTRALGGGSKMSQKSQIEDLLGELTTLWTPAAGDMDLVRAHLSALGPLKGSLKGILSLLDFDTLPFWDPNEELVGKVFVIEGGGRQRFRALVIRTLLNRNIYRKGVVHFIGNKKRFTVRCTRCDHVMVETDSICAGVHVVTSFEPYHKERLMYDGSKQLCVPVSSTKGIGPLVEVIKSPLAVKFFTEYDNEDRTRQKLVELANEMYNLNIQPTSTMGLQLWRGVHKSLLSRPTPAQMANMY